MIEVVVARSRMCGEFETSSFMGVKCADAVKRILDPVFRPAPPFPTKNLPKK